MRTRLYKALMACFRTTRRTKSGDLSANTSELPCPPFELFLPGVGDQSKEAATKRTRHLFDGQVPCADSRVLPRTVFGLSQKVRCTDDVICEKIAYQIGAREIGVT